MFFNPREFVDRRRELLVKKNAPQYQELAPPVTLFRTVTKLEKSAFHRPPPLSRVPRAMCFCSGFLPRPISED